MKRQIFIGKLDNGNIIRRVINTNLSDDYYLYFEDGNERFDIIDEVIEEIDDDDIDEEWWETIDIESYDIEEISC